ncbi:MAG: helicase-associated domain-containing protein [Alicyclobacillaceae bacterium]|nr:helicase-associated domain-containing protein [Alicyclobacillaceae bacterium]
MRLTDCLNAADIGVLRTIAARCGAECHAASKLSLIQGIVARLGPAAEVCRRVEALPPLRRELVLALTCDTRTALAKEDLSAAVRRVYGSGVDWREAVEPFLSEGWLFPAGRRTAREVYHIPEEIRRGVRLWIRQRCRETCPESPEPMIWRDEGTAAVRDTAVFLAYVERHRPPLTAQGALYRRNQHQLFRLMEIREEPLGPVTWRFGYGRRFYDYPDRFALIYDFCYARGYVKEMPGDRLELGGEVRAWLELPDAEKLRDLFAFWRMLYRRAIPNLRAVLIWVAHACEQRWIERERLDRLLDPYVEGYYYEDARTVKHRRIYNMLVHLGILASGMTEEGVQLFRATGRARELLLGEWTELPEPAAEGLIVQPQFEVLVPPEWVSRVAVDLGTFADPVRGDGMHVYRLHRAAVRRAVELGWSGEAIVRWLRRHSPYDVPGHVESQILQWSGSP